MTAAGLRVATRLAARAARRSRWRSVLVVMLIALPVTAMTGATAIIETVTPTPERRATTMLGAADLLVTPIRPDADRELLVTMLPAGSRIEALAITGDQGAVAGTEFGVEVRAIDLDGLGKGMLDLLAGRTPQQPDEVAISPRVGGGGLELGDPLSLEALGPTTVVGFVEDPSNLRAPVVLADPSLAGTMSQAGATPFLVDLPPGASSDEVTDLLSGFEPGSEVDSEVPPFAVTTRARAGAPTPAQTALVFVLGGLALVEAALVASAAFAVSVRRRQRELGLLGAVGAESRHLRASVLAEGMLLGSLGAIVGVLLGVAAALATGPWLDELTDRRNPPLVLQPQWLLIAAGIGLAAALVAAAIPARIAARVPVLEALSGRRPAVAPARRTLRLGLVTVGLAFAITLAGSAYRMEDTDGTVSAVLLLCGAVLGVLGFGACSPWLLERLEGVASRLPISARLALRDTARFRSRNGPIVTAVLAGFAATVALAAILSSQDAEAAERYSPMLRSDQLIVAGAGQAAAGPEIARQLNAIAAAPMLRTGSEGTSYMTIVLGTGDDAVYLSDPAVGDETLLKALGGEDATDAFREGAFVLFVDRPVAGPAILTVHQESTSGRMTEEVVGEIPYRALPTDVPRGTLPTAVISHETAQRYRFEAIPEGRYLVRLPRPVTDQDLTVAGDLLSTYPDTFVTVETGPYRAGEAFRMVLLLASLAFALSVTGVAVALGEAETRPDQRTLLALGADPAVRRRITAARAGVLAAIAGVLAVPAGLLPVWGVLFSRGSPIVVPIPEVLAALAILPVTAVVGAALLSRPIGPWAAYRT